MTIELAAQRKAIDYGSGCDRLHANCSPECANIATSFHRLALMTFEIHVTTRFIQSAISHFMERRSLPIRFLWDFNVILGPNVVKLLATQRTDCG